MTYPKPGRELIGYSTGSPWTRTYQLENQDGSAIDATGMEAYFEVWDVPRTVKYATAAITWNSRNPASLTVTLSAPQIAIIAAANPSGRASADLLIVNGTKRQYLVEVEMAQGTPPTVP